MLGALALVRQRRGAVGHEAALAAPAGRSDDGARRGDEGGGRGPGLGAPQVRERERLALVAPQVVARLRDHQRRRRVGRRESHREQVPASPTFPHSVTPRPSARSPPSRMSGLARVAGRLFRHPCVPRGQAAEEGEERRGPGVPSLVPLSSSSSPSSQAAESSRRAAGHRALRARDGHVQGGLGPRCVGRAGVLVRAARVRRGSVDLLTRRLYLPLFRPRRSPRACPARPGDPPPTGGPTFHRHQRAWPVLAPRREPGSLVRGADVREILTPDRLPRLFLPLSSPHSPPPRIRPTLRALFNVAGPSSVRGTRWRPSTR